MSTARTRHLAAPLVLAVLMALPLLLFRYPPMTDLPWHQGLVGVLRYRNDAAVMPPGLYELNLGHPNQLFHLMSWALSYVFSVDIACRSVVAVAVFGVVLGAARLAQSVGAHPWICAFTAPFLYGFIFLFGLVANLLGLAILLFALPTLDRFCAKPTWRGVWQTCVWLVALYFAHESALVMALVALGVFSVVHFGQRVQVALIALPIGFGVTLMALQKVLERHALSAFGAEFAERGIRFRPLLAKLRFFPQTLVGDVEPEVQWGMMGLLLLAMIALHFAARSHPPRSRHPRRIRHRFTILGAVLGLLFFAMPWSVGQGTMVYERFLPLTILLPVLTLAPRSYHSPQGRIALAFVTLLPVAMMATMLPRFLDADTVHRDLDAVFTHMETNSTVGLIHVGPSSQARGYSAAAGGSRVLAAKGGRLLFSFVDSPLAPVRFADGRAWDDATRRYGYNKPDVHPACDLGIARYLLVHAADSNAQAATASALQRDAKSVFVRGEWLLVEAKKPARPLDATGDVDCTQTDTLWQRFGRQR